MLYLSKKLGVKHQLTCGFKSRQVIVLIINANFPFIENATVLNILEIARTYGSLLLVAVVGLEAMSKRNLVFQIIFLAMLAIVVVFLFFPDTYSNLIDLVK